MGNCVTTVPTCKRLRQNNTTQGPLSWPTKESAGVRKCRCALAPRQFQTNNIRINHTYNFPQRRVADNISTTARYQDNILKQKYGKSANANCIAVHSRSIRNHKQSMCMNAAIYSLPNPTQRNKYLALTSHSKSHNSEQRHNCQSSVNRKHISKQTETTTDVALPKQKLC